MSKQKKKEIKNEFRQHKVSGHPTYIYRKVGDSFEYIGITHAKVTNKTNNIELCKNPDPHDKKKAYMRPKPSKDRIHKFKEPLKGWKLNSEDREKAKRIANKKKKRATEN